MTTAQEAVFVVTLNEAPTAPVTLNYTTVDGTATVAAGNYTVTSGVLTFAAGETTQNVIVPVNLPLPAGSPSELFSLAISWPTGSSNMIARSPGICTLPGSVIPIVSISSPVVL